MKNKINFIALFLACITLIVLSAFTSEEPSNSQSAEVAATKAKQTTSPNKDAQAKNEQPAADGFDVPLEFTLTDLAGDEVKASDFRGKWLVINYWATWCGPCRDEMPELVKFQAEHENVQVVGIAFEDAEIQKLKNFAQDFNITYPLLTIDVYNPPGFAEEGGLGLPTTIVYNPEGMRHKKHMGPIDAAGLLEMIQATK
ncbi:MAG: TlpA family protein disulfide reductase [Marinicella sp.]